VAHRALVNLELQLPFRVLIVTQNIDDLHERAGNQNLIHMHGELRKSRCAACDEVRPKLNDLDRDAVREHCVGKGTMRPQVVWFGQELLEQDPIGEALSLCALFLSIGISGSV
jgi:NAD-dependent deacetylase